MRKIDVNAADKAAQSFLLSSKEAHGGVQGSYGPQLFGFKVLAKQTTTNEGALVQHCCIQLARPPQSLGSLLNGTSIDNVELESIRKSDLDGTFATFEKFLSVRAQVH